MALICCVTADSRCICEKAAVCGGVHLFTEGCPQHILDNRDDQPAPYKSIVHELGEKAVERTIKEL